MVQIAAIAVCAVLCGAVLKKTVPELGLVLALGAGVLILFSIAGVLEELKTGLLQMVELSGMDMELMIPVVKAIGIAVLTRITAEVCKDAKEGGIAAFVEISGAALALLIALPLMEQVFMGIGRLL